MAELIEPLSSEFPDDMENIEPNLEDMHIMDDISGNDFLDISQSFSNGAIMDDSIEDDSIIYGNETTNPFGDETTLADETRDSVNISQYSHGSQGSLHESHLQGGNNKSVKKSAKKTAKKNIKRSARKEQNKTVKNKTRKAKKTRKTKKTRKAKKIRKNKKTKRTMKQ